MKITDVCMFPWKEGVRETDCCYCNVYCKTDLQFWDFLTRGAVLLQWPIMGRGGG
jgi:hypothetical protein